MKKLNTLILLFLISPTLFAKRGRPDTEADYIVPTSPKYVPYSRFKVKIVDRFKGPQTEKISYIFPEFLVGEADKVFSLKKIPGTQNSWAGKELGAHCTVIDDDFSCNIYVNKLTGQTTLPSEFSAQKAMKHLPKLNLSSKQIQGLSGVIQSFYNHEPAGFLSYSID